MAQCLLATATYAPLRQRLTPYADNLASRDRRAYCHRTYVVTTTAEK